MAGLTADYVLRDDDGNIVACTSGLVDSKLRRQQAELAAIFDGIRWVDNYLDTVNARKKLFVKTDHWK
ncbi:hypothetical protein CCACVL1_12261, partial [Corchorus capsularis]